MSPTPPVLRALKISYVIEGSTLGGKSGFVHLLARFERRAAEAP